MPTKKSLRLKKAKRATSSGCYLVLFAKIHGKRPLWAPEAWCIPAFDGDDPIGFAATNARWIETIAAKDGLPLGDPKLLERLDRRIVAWEDEKGGAWRYELALVSKAHFIRFPLKAIDVKRLFL